MPPIRSPIPDLPSRRRISQVDTHLSERPYAWQKFPHLASGIQIIRQVAAAEPRARNEVDVLEEDEEEEEDVESEDPTELGLPKLPAKA